MLRDQNQPEAPNALGSGSISDAGPAPADAVVLPSVRALRWPSWPRVAIDVGPRAGGAAIAALVLATFAIVACASAGPSILVPRSVQTFPNWESGPLHYLFSRPIDDPQTLGLIFSGVLVAMFVAYLVVLGAVRKLPMRTIAIVIVVLHAILLLSPPLQLTDLFNYLGYARLGGLHHLNPYTHVIKQAFYDPVYRFTSWHNLKSPYGPLFTALTYPLALLSLPIAYWIVKLATVSMSLAFIALVWHCARRLERDPRFAVAFVAFNPVFLIYAVAGFHNDFFMLVPSMGAIALVMARRDRSAGAAIMVAIAVKYTAVLVLPFLLLGARSRERALRMTTGMVGTALPLIALYLALFGTSIPNLSDQSSLLTDFSIPNLFGLLIGIGGTPGLLKVATVAVVVVVAYEVWRRREWLTAAGWSTLALIVSLAWLVPWYVIWLLPLAALGRSLRLRRCAVALTLFLVLAFMPATPLFMSKHGIDPLGTSAGQASRSLQHKLAY